MTKETRFLRKKVEFQVEETKTVSIVTHDGESFVGITLDADEGGEQSNFSKEDIKLLIKVLEDALTDLTDIENKRKTK